MLIKLPSSVVNSSQLAALVGQLDAGQMNSTLSEQFFDSNPRISQEPQAIKMVVEYLQRLLEKPVEMEVAFAQTPDADFIAELTTWIRVNIHSGLLLNIKTDPLLTGGFVLRSPQRIYDFSWAHTLEAQRDSLTKLVTHAN